MQKLFISFLILFTPLFFFSQKKEADTIYIQFDYTKERHYEKKNDTLFIKKDNDQKIYIEKNRNSDNYKYLNDFNDFRVRTSSKKLKTLNFSEKWIRIYRYKKSYILYSPCDWMNDTKIFIDDKKIQFKNSEISEFKIKSIKKKDENIFIRYSKSKNSKKTILKIHPVDKDLGIYEFTFYDGLENYKYLMVNEKNYLKYDIIVNDCTKSKLKEFEFD